MYIAGLKKVTQQFIGNHTVHAFSQQQRIIPPLTTTLLTHTPKTLTLLQLVSII